MTHTYNALGQLTHFTQKTVQDSDLNGSVTEDDDKTITEKVIQSFSSSDGRVISSERTITEKGTTAAATLNHTYTTKTSVQYDSTHAGLPGYEVTTTYDGDRITSETTNITYNALTRRVSSRDVKTTVCDAAGTLNSNSQTSVTFAGYDDFGQATGYTVTTTQNGKTTVQAVSGITYNDSGDVVSQASSFSETVAGKPSYLREWSTVSENQVWDKLGLMLSANRLTTERGKLTTETLSNMAYDAKGRLLSSASATRQIRPMSRP
jgi:hypothetical protein